MTEIDPYNLNRFVEAQEEDYPRALAEIKGGRKRTHWMWYIFPQFNGLGFSPTSIHYSIKNLAEAKAYLDHPVLGPRLAECFEAVVAISGRSARDLWLSRRYEAAIVRNSVRARLFAGIGVSTAPGQVFWRQR